MKTSLQQLVSAAIVLTLCETCIAGPKVTVHPNVAGVTIRDPKFDIVRELRDPSQIKIVRDAFLRAKRVGDTSTKLKKPTHKFDFSDRWLVDIESGEFGVLTKVVTDVYQLESKDLSALKELLKKDGEQAASSNH